MRAGAVRADRPERAVIGGPPKLVAVNEERLNLSEESVSLGWYTRLAAGDHGVVWAQTFVRELVSVTSRSCL